MAAVQNRIIATLRDEGIDPNGPIYVTQPYLPPLEEFIPYLEEIWATKKLTNGGPFHQQLEKALEKANVLIFGLNSMIDYAEKELKVPVRKKRGTKL